MTPARDRRDFLDHGTFRRGNHAVIDELHRQSDRLQTLSPSETENWIAAPEMEPQLKLQLMWLVQSQLKLWLVSHPKVLSRSARTRSKDSNLTFWRLLWRWEGWEWVVVVHNCAGQAARLLGVTRANRI